jgi:hypothetical protein
VPKAAHEDLVVLREARFFGQGLGEVGAGAAQLVVVEQEVVEDGELGVGRDLAVADLFVECAKTIVAAGRI